MSSMKSNQNKGKGEREERFTLPCNSSASKADNNPLLPKQSTLDSDSREDMTNFNDLLNLSICAASSAQPINGTGHSQVRVVLERVTKYSLLEHDYEPKRFTVKCKVSI